jgi:Zn-dependent peptidase ImmA (M78 family)
MPRKKAKVFKFTNTKGVHYEAIFRKPDSRAYDDADGICYDPDDPQPKIYIKPGMSPQRELNTCVHELAHAFFWNRPEYQIARFASTVSRFLYAQGWRKEKKD